MSETATEDDLFTVFVPLWVENGHNSPLCLMYDLMFGLELRADGLVGRLVLLFEPSEVVWRVVLTSSTTSSDSPFCSGSTWGFFLPSALDIFE
jgi:hypothetical protein